MKAHFHAGDFQLKHGRHPHGRGTWTFESADRTVQVEARGKYAAARARVAAAHPQVLVWNLKP